VIDNCEITGNYLHREVVGERIVLKRPLAGTTGPMLERLAGHMCSKCILEPDCKPEFVGEDIQNYYFIRTHHGISGADTDT